MKKNTGTFKRTFFLFSVPIAIIIICFAIFQILNVNMNNKKITNKQDITKLYFLYKDELYDKVEKESTYTDKIIKKTEKLYNTLTKEQCMLMDEIENLRTLYKEKQDKEIFTIAYSLGVKLIIESFM